MATTAAAAAGQAAGLEISKAAVGASVERACAHDPSQCCGEGSFMAVVLSGIPVPGAMSPVVTPSYQGMTLSGRF